MKIHTQIAILATTAVLTACSTLPERNLHLTRPPKCAKLSPAFTARDGHHIAYRKWSPRGKPRAVIAAITGWQSSACDWDVVGKSLSRRGYELNVSGRRGQWGDVEQTRADPHALGDIRSWKQWMEDYADFTRVIAARHPGTPLVYGALSLGTTETLVVAGDRRWGGAKPDALFIASPAFVFLDPSEELTRTEFLARFSPPKKRFGDLELAEQSKVHIIEDDTLWKEWSQSQDRVESYTTRWLLNMFAAGRSARRAASAVECPARLLWGGRDPLLAQARKDAPERLRTRMKLPRSAVREFPKGSHALWAEEPVRGEVLQDLGRWLDRTLTSATH